MLWVPQRGVSLQGGPSTAPASGILVWDMTANQEGRRLPERPNSHFVFSPDGKTLACHDFGSSIRLWDVASGQPRQQWFGHDYAVWALAVSPDGKTIASGDFEGKLFLWDTVTGKARHVLHMPQPWLGGYFFSADSRRITSAGMDGVFRVWDVDAGKEVRRFAVDWPQRKRLELFALQLSLDGKQVAATAFDKAQDHAMQLFVWDAATGKRLLQRPYHLDTYASPATQATGTVPPAAFAPDGERVTVRLGDRVGIAEVATGSLLAKLPQGVGRPLAFSPDGRSLAAVIAASKPATNPFQSERRTAVSLIETASGEEIVRVNTGDFTDLAFTPDSRSIVAADGNGLHVWDTATSERRHRMAWPEGFSGVRALAVMPDGRVVADMSSGDLLLWDLSPARRPRPKAMPGPNGKELQALWSDLKGDARTAYRAVVRLTAAPAQSVIPYLDVHLQSAAEDGKRIEQLLANLDSDDFQTREAASRELARLHYRIDTRLRQTLQDNPSPEMRRRLQDILVEPKRLPGEVLRTVRSIAVLERIGTPEARLLS